MFWTKLKSMVSKKQPSETRPSEEAQALTVDTSEMLTIKVNELSIDLEHKKGPLVLRHAPWDKDDPVRPWRPFLTWYFGKQSSAYWLSTDTGGVMVRRQDITYFKIQTREKKAERES